MRHGSCLAIRGALSMRLEIQERLDEDVCFSMKDVKA